MTRCRIAARSSAARTGDCVQIDVMRKPAVGMIHEVELNRIILTYPNELAGNLSSEGPKRVLDSLGDRHVHFTDLQFDDDFAGLSPGNARRNDRSISQDRIDGFTALTAGFPLYRTAFFFRVLFV